jgi:hypothetical protein
MEPMDRELELREGELYQAKARLVRWNEMGNSLSRTHEVGWSSVRRIREDGVKRLQSLLEQLNGFDPGATSGRANGSEGGGGPLEAGSA